MPVRPRRKRTAAKPERAAVAPPAWVAIYDPPPHDPPPTDASNLAAWRAWEERRRRHYEDWLTRRAQWYAEHPEAMKLDLDDPPPDAPFDGAL